MKMMDIHITIIAYFLTNTLNWDVIWGKAKEKNTLVSGNVGGEKNLHLGGCKFIFLTNLTENFK